MANKIFRKKALDTVSSPEQLDQHVRITRPSVWIIMIAIIALIIGAGAWACTAEMTQGFEISSAILWPASGVNYSLSKTSGTVRDVLVGHGDYVSEGYILASIPNEEILNRIASTPEGTALDALRYEYATTSLIKAESTSYVQNVVYKNNEVTSNQVISACVPVDEVAGTKEIIAYVPYTTARGLSVGTEVQVSPSTAPREQYGYIKGVISDIGTVTVNDETIEKTMGTTQYKDVMGIDESCVEIRMKLYQDDSSYNGYLWSNDKGKMVPGITIGTACSVKVVQGRIHPINLLFG